MKEISETEFSDGLKKKVNEQEEEMVKNIFLHWSHGPKIAITLILSFGTVLVVWEMLKIK